VLIWHVSDDSENFKYITYVIYFVMDPNKKLIKNIFYGLFLTTNISVATFTF
jgi:hypothetical protein